MFGFEVVGAYLRTYHNVTSDGLTRLSRTEVDALIRRHGLTRIDPKPSWELYLRPGWSKRALVWVGQSEAERRIALQLSDRRQSAPPPASLGLLGAIHVVRFRVIEWRGTLGGYSRAAQAAGAMTSLIPAAGVPGPEIHAGLAGSPSWRGPTRRPPSAPCPWP